MHIRWIEPANADYDGRMSSVSPSSSNSAGSQDATEVRARVELTSSDLPGEVSDASLVVPGEDLWVRHWPMVQEPVKGVIFMTLVTGMAASALLKTQQPAMGALVIVAFLAVTTWFWIPVVVRLHQSGIDVHRFAWWKRPSATRTFLRIPWHLIKRWESTERGVMLLPTNQRLPIEYMNGMFLSWGGQREAMEAKLRLHLAQRKRISSGSSRIRVGSTRNEVSER
ncbi:MAG: hypothetical protein R3C28_20070 [Pirellulaceae bacterium]